jgi:hypothetical protein
MLGRNYNEVNTPLLNRIPWLVFTDSRHAEVGLVRDPAFTTGIWCHIHRTRVRIIPDDTMGSSEMVHKFTT